MPKSGHTLMTQRGRHLKPKTAKNASKYENFSSLIFAPGLNVDLSKSNLIFMANIYTRWDIHFDAFDRGKVPRKFHIIWAGQQKNWNKTAQFLLQNSSCCPLCWCDVERREWGWNYCIEVLTCQGCRVLAFPLSVLLCTHFLLARFTFCFKSTK